jgi:hypothetical protein
VQKGEATAANDDGRLPFTDKGTRVVIFGTTSQQASVVAAEIAKKAYWNSSYFGGTFDDLVAAGLVNHRPVVVSKNAALAAGDACTAVVRAADLDNGSYDPDSGDPLRLAAIPEGPFGLGQHPVSLIGTDRFGAAAASSAFVTVADQSGPSIGEVAVRSDREVRHGMTLFTIDYTASDNCSAATTELSVASRDGDERDAQVIDAHHVLLKHGGRDTGDDVDDDARFAVSILATDEAGNRSITKIAIGARTNDR